MWLLALLVMSASTVPAGEVPPLPAPMPRYLIDSVAGSDYAGDGGPALAAHLAGVEGVAVDASGNVYFSDNIDHRIRKVSPSGVITTVAGNGHPGFAGDGGPASEALLNRPYGLAVDSANRLYVADLGNGRVRRISPDGVITTIAGGGQNRPGGGSADPLAAKFTPRNVAVGRDGTVYFSDFADHRIFKVTPEGRIQHVAGAGSPGYEADSRPAATARLNAPAGLAVDASGALYVADSGNRRIRRIQNGIITTVIDHGKSGPGLSAPTGVAVDAWGNLLVADSGEGQVRARLSWGEIVTLATAGRSATPEGVRLNEVRDVAVDAAGNVYIAARSRVFRLAAGQRLGLLAGTGSFGFSGDGGPALEARLYFPRSVAVDADGRLYIADQRNRRVRISTPQGRIGTVAGTGERGSSGDGGFATLARLVAPSAAAVDASGGLWIADEGGHRVRLVSREGIIATAAGTGTQGVSGDGGPAWMAQLSAPLGVAAGGGSIYIADSLNHRVRRLSPGGILATIAGSGIRGYGGDGGPALEAQLDTPDGVAVDGAGNVYFSDAANHCVRRVTSGGLIETVAGNGVLGFAGDGGPAREALLHRPAGIALDGQGNLFIADSGNHRIRAVSRDGIIRTIAGNGSPGFSGDGGPALLAGLDQPTGVAAGKQGVIYVADFNNHRIRKLAPLPEVIPPAPLEPEPAPQPAAPEPALQPLAVLNSASLAPGPIAAGQLVTILGAGLGPQTEASAQPEASGAIGTTLAGVRVLFSGIAAPVLAAQSSRVQVQAPYRIAGRPSTSVEVLYEGVKRGEALVEVASAAPALFTVSGGRGQALAANEDGSRNSSSNPAAPGSIVILYATGDGAVHPSLVEGLPAREPFPAPALPVKVTAGGLAAEVLYAGPAPGMVGVFQLNVRLPAGYVPSGALPVVLHLGPFQSQAGVTITLK